jgi:hypothetical protein
MPLLVPPPTASESGLQGLPPEALVALLKQEVSHWIKLQDSNQEMTRMVEEALQGRLTSEGIRLDSEDVQELQQACLENVEVM